MRSPCSQLLTPLSAAVWNFPSANEHHLPLEVGETVHILQASEGKGSWLGLSCTRPGVVGPQALLTVNPSLPLQAGTAGTRSGTGLPG